MPIKLRLLGVVCAAAFSFASMSSNAALMSVLGGQAVYDSDRNISWVANANLAASNTFGLAYDTNLGDNPEDPYGPNYIEQIHTDGTMNWGAALHWIDAMNTANYLGFNNWSLPTSLNQDGSGPCGPALNCTSSEMGHLYYTEGVTAATPGLLFSNVQIPQYWSSTELANNPSWAWTFNFGNGNGFQGVDAKYESSSYAWAVHPGNVGVAVVPVPAAAWLFSSGLLGLIGVTRRSANA